MGIRTLGVAMNAMKSRLLQAGNCRGIPHAHLYHQTSPYLPWLSSPQVSDRAEGADFCATVRFGHSAQPRERVCRVDDKFGRLVNSIRAHRRGIQTSVLNRWRVGGTGAITKGRDGNNRRCVAACSAFGAHLTTTHLSQPITWHAPTPARPN